MSQYESKMVSNGTGMQTAVGLCLFCISTCSGSCSGDCSGGCNKTCKGTCATSCKDGCYSSYAPGPIL